MIQWVHERASSLFAHVLVATDDQRIADAVKAFGGLVQMTSPEHRSGTERCAEAASLYEEQSGQKFQFVVNIQGDEPLIRPEQLQTLTDCIRIPGTGIATLIRPLENSQEVNNPNVVKVVVDRARKALYFSRSPIPFIRDPGSDAVEIKNRFFSHIGLYAFRRETLEKVVKLPPTALELAESLEQLRWLEHGIPIQTAITQLSSTGVDTPEDLESLRKKLGF
jgi:3-deoxy-manno-octulosonate cytidylyltransferase (CMP-KDO synthetase)